jgi:ATP-binding cassette subfamily C protein
VFLFSIFVNLLMLTGPIFMLQVYDRVLSSRAEATLIALMALVAFLYLMMGLLDHARGRIAARSGARFQDRLDARVFAASLKRLAVKPDDGPALAAQRDLESVRHLLGAPTFLALFDMPWAPIFMFAIFVFHPWLGVLAVVGGGFLILVSLLNQRVTRRPMSEANGRALEAERYGEQIKAESEVVQSLGMRGTGFARWHRARSSALGAGIGVSDLAGGFTTFSKTFRLFLQSAILGLGAWLVLQGELTPGAMIAASILLGRALAPVDAVIGQWGMVARAREGWGRLAELLAREPEVAPRTALPRPRAVVEGLQLTVAPPGESKAALRMVSFRVEPGQALGVIGPSGAGKSSLARTVIGAWRPAGGTITLDGAALDQYDPDVLGRYIGYVPQRVTLFEGTIADNIARLDPMPDPEKVVAAARRAGAHEMVVALDDGYDTRVGPHGGRLSGGQVQRIGLARALYGDPVLLVLDEPNSNLDNEGSVALNAAIRAVKAEGGAVMIMAHRPAAIQECDMLLVIDNGQRTAFGPRDQVLREMVRNHTELLRTPPAGAAPAGAPGGAAGTTTGGAT